ncbi:MAG TPA: anti-sigma factor [Gemmatimonadaceae bacterium]|nr:anti-sigma factor [Gemmatimonadaceae bacterium]
MRCSDCRDVLNAYVDDEMMPSEMQEIREHLATCADCEREHRLLAETSLLLRDKLVRHSAPDVLKARIRNALAQPNAFDPPREVKPQRTWMRLAAASVLVAIVSSAVTFAAARQGTPSRSIADDVLASHIRSLMPGHLTDVASTNQHNVKPWFNGRIGLSPPVPSLDSAAFRLIGGRLDYIDGRSVAAVVYARRDHMINVYAWPTTSRTEETRSETTDRGYHLVHWRNDGIEYWAVSDLNRPELDQFVAAFTSATTASR